jgi:HAMP domain
VKTIRKNGIGRNIARLVAAATFLASFGVATLLTAFDINSHLTDRKQSLEATAFALASAAADATRDGDRQGAQLALTAIARIPHITMAGISLPDGRPLAAMGQTTLLSTDVVKQDQTNLSLLLKGSLPVSVDIVKGGAPVGRLTMISDISHMRASVAISVLTAFLAAMLVAAAGVFASRPLQGRILTPLISVTRAMQNIRATRDYSASLPERAAEDEPAMLITSFNGMMADIRPTMIR